jgi:hypothetical protein
MTGERALLRAFQSVRSPTKMRSGVYESRDVRDDFRHNVHRTDLPVGVQSMEVNASLPSNRAADACGDLFDFRWPPSAATRFLRGAWAGEAKPNPRIREVPWRKVSVLMGLSLKPNAVAIGWIVESLAPYADDFCALPYSLRVLWRGRFRGRTAQQERFRYLSVESERRLSSTP